MTEQPKRNPGIRAIIIFSLLVFLLSLTQTALTYNDFNGTGSYSSISLFAIGGVSILGGALPEWLTWMANPIYIVAVFLFAFKKKAAIVLSTIATLIAFSFLFWNDILVSENGRTVPIISVKFGYICWLASMIILMTGTRIYLKKEKTE